MVSDAKRQRQRQRQRPTPRRRSRSRRGRLAPRRSRHGLRAGEFNELASVLGATGATAAGAFIHDAKKKDPSLEISGVQHAGGTAAGGLAGYALGEVVHDAIKGVRNVTARAKNQPHEKLSWSDVAPLAVGAATGGLGYFNPKQVMGTVMGDSQEQISTYKEVPTDVKQYVGAGSAALGYGAASVARDAYEAYKKKSGDGATSGSNKKGAPKLKKDAKSKKSKRAKL